MPTLTKTRYSVKTMAADDDNDDEVMMAQLDPLDPRKVSLDIFELYCQEMLMASSVGRRAYLIDKMRVSVS